MAAPQLIPQRHHHKRWMITERLQHRKAFTDQIFLLLLIVMLIGFVRNRSPKRQLRLHINAKQISSGERCIRWTAGVESIVVDTVGLRYA
ncbi:hypothetical protein D3C71_2035310 [compost metagenome]